MISTNDLYSMRKYSIYGLELICNDSPASGYLSFIEYTN